MIRHVRLQKENEVIRGQGDSYIIADEFETPKETWLGAEASEISLDSILMGLGIDVDEENRC